MEPKNRIAEKAEEPYMRFGIRCFSMEKMAEALGIINKILNQFVAAKDQLVVEVV